MNLRLLDRDNAVDDRAEIRKVAFHKVCASASMYGRKCRLRLRFRTISTRRPEHLSVYQTSPELREREAFEEKLDGAPEATGEPGKFSAGELGRLTVRVFFSAGAGLLAWSHMPVETAQ